MEMYIGLAVLVVVLIWVVMTYNRFISLRRFKDEAWSGIAVQLKRRHDLAPNLLSLVKRYAQHEKELLEEISRQRGELVGSTRQIADSERQYSGTLGRVFALGEAYPELKASENYLALQQSLSEIEEQLQMARRYFNVRCAISISWSSLSPACCWRDCLIFKRKCSSSWTHQKKLNHRGWRD